VTLAEVAAFTLPLFLYIQGLEAAAPIGPL